MALANARTQAAPVHAEEALQHRFERSFAVEEQGWIRVPLEIATQAHILPRGVDVRILDSADREIPYSWEPTAPATISLGPEAASVSEIADGWLIEFDLGSDPPRHHALNLPFRAESAAEVAIETSPDARAWNRAGQADLFRLGENAASTRMDYAATNARYVRVLWPRQAGFPALRDEPVQIFVAPVNLLEAPVSYELVASGDGWAEYELLGPGAGVAVEHLIIRLDGAGSAAYALGVPDAGVWVETADGLLSAQAPGVIPVNRWAPTVRLRLWSGGQTHPQVAGAKLAARPLSLLFFAQEAGEYRLVYGGTGRVPPAYPPQREQHGDIALAVLGPEAAIPLPDLPVARLAVGPALSRDGFAAEYRLQSQAKRGELVLLDLPTSAYELGMLDSADADPEPQPHPGMRILHDGRQVPYIRVLPSDPVVVADVAGLQPVSDPPPAQSEVAASRSVHRSAVTLELGDVNLPLTQIEISSRAIPFDRPVSVHALGKAADGRVVPTTVLARGVWHCPGVDVVPCRTVLRPSPNPSLEVRIEFDDGDNPPLDAVDIRVYRRGDRLLFPWPAGDVELVVGHAQLGRARYDLELLRDDLLLRPTKPVSATLVHAGATQAFDVRKPALLAVLAAAAVALLLVLRRSLTGDPTA